MSLSALPLVDLCIGPTWADYTEHSGANAARVALGPEYASEIAHLRESCRATRQDRGEDEFSLLHGGLIYRVTAFEAIDGGKLAATYFLARGTASVLPIEKLGLPPQIRTKLADPNLTGLVLVCGPRGAGKTTTVSTILNCRLKLLGGMALALQDPIETLLAGEHGAGRCVQVPISRRHGGYSDALLRAARTRVGMLLLGEIREASTAALALETAASGILVLSTLHGDPAQARNLRTSLNRLFSAATRDLDGRTGAAAELIASSLSLMIQQRLEPIRPGSNIMRAVLSCLDLTDPNDGAAMRTMLRAQEFDRLQQAADDQARRLLHRPRESHAQA